MIILIVDPGSAGITLKNDWRLNSIFTFMHCGNCKTVNKGVFNLGMLQVYVTKRFHIILN